MSQQVNINDLAQYYINQANSSTTPVIRPIPSQQTVVDPEYNANLQSYLNNIQQNPVTPQSEMQIRNPNLSLRALGENAAKDLQSIATGLTAVASHPILTAKNIGKAYYDYNLELGQKPLLQRLPYALDSINLLTEPIISTQDIRDVASGKKSVGRLLADPIKNIWENPVSSGLTLFGAGALAKGAKATARTATTGNIVEDAINLGKQTTGKKASKIVDQANKIKSDYSPMNIDAAIEALNTGKTVSQELKPVTKELAKLYDTYDEILSTTNKSAKKYIGKNEKLAIADSQAAQADELARGVQRTFQDIQKERKPILEILKEENGAAKVQKLADEGNVIAKDVLKNKANFDKGYLKITPMSGIKDVNKLGQVAAAGTRYADRASQRVFGTATTEQIRNNLINDTVNWMDNQMGQLVKNEIADEIRNGTLGGRPLITETSKDVKYVPREVIEAGDLDDIVRSATKEVGKGADVVPIDNTILKEIENQIVETTTGSPFGKGFLSDLYRTGKVNALASGQYLGGNAITGLANMIYNEGINPINWAKDLTAAIQTKGQLAKDLGVYRQIVRQSSKIDNPVLKTISKWNEPLSNVIQSVDAKMQNTFAEIAANNNLRNKGIAVSERAKAIEEMSKINLAQTIDDVKKVALINPSKTILPRQLHGVMGLTNPFWRWMDTAAQSSIHMMKKNPLLANYVTVNGLARAGFDTEMQERMRLGVDLDKPFVSYKFNPKTGQVMETTAEILPVMNTLKLTGNLASYASTGDSKYLEGALGQQIPFLAAVGNSFFGKDQFGNPLKRKGVDDDWYKHNAISIQDGKRYKYDAYNNQFTELGTQGDEIINTAISNLLVYPRFLNNTVAPALAGMHRAITGSDVQFYKPYSGSLLGQFGEGGRMITGDLGNAVAGDPLRPASLTGFSGMYERPYYQRRELPILPKNVTRGLIRSNIRRDQRINQMRGGY